MNSDLSSSKVIVPRVDNSSKPVSAPLENVNKAGICIYMYVLGTAHKILELKVSDFGT